MELRLKQATFLVFLISLVACASAPASGPRAVRPIPPSLEEFIDQATTQPSFEHALWGILVEEEDGRQLYAKNPDVLMMPASNRKLFTAALAAECIGVSSTIPTELWMEGTVEDNTLQGNLVLKGYGDPSLGGRYEADRDTRLRPFLDALIARGIHQVRGGVIADVSQFDRETIPGSWKTDNLGDSDAAPADALAWNENVVGVLLDARDCLAPNVTTDPSIVPLKKIDLACVPPVDSPPVEPRMRTDAANALMVWGQIDRRTAARPYGELVAVEEPGLYAAQALHDFLERNGIRIAGESALQTAPRLWTEKLASIESPPMSLLLGTFLKSSSNLFGEMFFKASTRQVPATYSAARQLERAFLTHEVGLEPTEFSFDDGSGLSTENLVTPRAVMKMLRYLNRGGRRGLYDQLLTTPGEEGTLRRRLAGLEQSMRGKTGTLDGVNALSGYVTGRDGRLRYFAIMANHHIGASSAAITIIDSIVRRIADF